MLIQFYPKKMNVNQTICIALVFVRITTNIAKIKSLVRSYLELNLMLTKADVK